MKVYNKKDFLKLPEGSVFCKGCKWCFENLSIKGKSFDSDFLYVDLCNIDAFDTAQWVDRLEDSLKNGTSYQINNDTSRDGLFQEEAIFLVFEKKDLEYLIKVLNISINSLMPL